MTHVANKLNSNQSIYRFVAEEIADDKEGVYQVSLRAHRKERVPRFKVGEQDVDHPIPGWENEKHSALIFTCNNAGFVIVSAYPHSSSNHEISQKEPFLLAAYNDCEKLRKHVLSYRISHLVYAYLDLQRVSSFDCTPTHKSKRILRRLAARAEKEIDLFQEDRERRIENHRINWTLGTAAVAALLAVTLQSLGATVDSFLTGRPINVIPTILTSIPALMLLFTLKRTTNK
ncbi:hypothetical protein CJP73_10085 [Neopusillimonas maritima]|uniref:Uncharacterized protein n=1 Tax=Neopusillimonas maritima TaxID=2026239 RepID=A0A3A1YSK1_9BURK|nr:hypothetical protein CJP73_10085 [Neopusillimonas maritima]